MKRLKKGRSLVLVFMSIFFFIIAATFIAVIILSPGNVEQFKDSNGRVLENSIAEKTFINVNGAKQGMIIKGKIKIIQYFYLFMGDLVCLSIFLLRIIQHILKIILQ